jgi:iron complex outermembrane recepter protein
MAVRIRFAIQSLALLALTTGAAAVAETETATDAVSTLIVTGELRDTELVRLPVSVSVLDDAVIAARNAQHLDQLAAMVPNLNYAGGTSRARYFQMRGIGERSAYARPLNASVGLLIDGVDFSGLGGAWLHDVSQVEVFRGPQGTLFGASGLAGVINVVTNAPTPHFEAGARVRAGNYGSQGIGGHVSGPASDTLSYRLAAEQYRSDGFTRNEFLDRRDTGEIDERTVRGRLHWAPRNDTRVDVMLGHINADNGFDAFSLDNTRRTLSDEPGHDRHRSNFGSIAMALDTVDRFTLEAMASHGRTRSDYGYDEDWTFVGFHPSGYSSFDNYHRTHRRSTAEVRLLSTDQGRLFGATDWAVGAFWQDQQADLRRDYTYLSAPFESAYDVRRLALFGQTETPVAGVARLTVGLRLERHSADYADSQGVEFDPADTLLGARVAIDYPVGANAVAYVAGSRGYKAGGFNADSGLDADVRRFDPEVLYNYELGLKGAWRDGTLNGRASVFYMRRHDAQLSLLRIGCRSS